MSANLRAFLALLRWCEGTAGPDGYRTMFGGELFENFADHPQKVVTKSLGGKMLSSSAAGAYQFLATTWAEVKAKLNLPDFSPESQDLAAIYLIKRRGALDDVEAGRLQDAIAKCAKEWASLPGSPYGQPVKTLAQCVEVYRKAGGFLDTAYAPAPEFKPAPLKDIVTGKGSLMPAPFIGLAFEALSALLPTLIRLKSNSPQGEVNAQIAEKVVPIVQAAVGASNAQEAVEKVANDPAAFQAADKAVRENYLELFEAGGGGIQGARDFALEMTSTGPEWRQIGFGLLIGFLAVGVVLGGGYVMANMLTLEGTDDQMSAQILDYFKAAGFIVLGWVFGSSARQARNGS